MIATKAVPLTITAVLFLSACEEGAFPGIGQSQPPLADNSATIVAPVGETVARDVERPDIFSTTENALWDGRPSLGGVWVAHPDVGDPERVTVTNNDNGRTVSGALFRRERNNPGPRIQVSSDAANALGMLAGSPTELSIVVVRTEEVEIAPPPMTDIEEATTPDEDTGTDAEAEAAAVAAATVATLADLPDADVSPEIEPSIDAEVLVEAAPEGEDIVPVVAPIDPVALAAATAAIIAADIAQEKAIAAAAAAEAAAAEQAALEETTASDASVPEVETGTIEPIAAAVTAAIDNAEAEAENPAGEETATADLKNPYIQVGLFKQEANANAAATSLRQAGIVPDVKEGSNASGPFWRVIVGPMTSAEDQSELLAQVKGLGYRDAFLTTN